MKFKDLYNDRWFRIKGDSSLFLKCPPIGENPVLYNCLHFFGGPGTVLFAWKHEYVGDESDVVEVDVTCSEIRERPEKGTDSLTSQSHAG